ncbi:MAG: hypothetical protein R3E50_06860 [Halioglobus sp.]
MSFQREKPIDTQISDYLLTASGHLKESKLPVDVRRMATYGAAASSMMVMMSQAEAAVVLNGGDAPPISVVNGVGTIYSSPGFNQFDMDGDGNNDFAVWGYSSLQSGTSGSPGNNGVAAAFGPYSSSNQEFGGGSDDLPKLSAGFTLGPSISTDSWTSSIMDTGNDLVAGPGNGLGAGWTGGPNELGFVGVRFVNASGTHYGWICLQSNPNPGNVLIQVNAYAYESTPDTPIQVGDTGNGIYDCGSIVTPPSTNVPVPVMGPLAYGLTSLALGSLCLAGMRRRREQRASQSRQ